jgi:hypothetical protein
MYFHPANTSLGTTDLKQRLLYMDKTIKATSDIVQQKSTISSNTTYIPTHPLVPIANKDTALLIFPRPCLCLAAPIQYWLPMSYQFQCSPSCIHATTKDSASTHNVHANPFIRMSQHPPADYETRQVNLLEEGLDLGNKFLNFLLNSSHQQLFVPIPFGL